MYTRRTPFLDIHTAEMTTTNLAVHEAPVVAARFPSGMWDKRLRQPPLAKCFKEKCPLWPIASLCMPCQSDLLIFRIAYHSLC